MGAVAAASMVSVTLLVPGQSASGSAPERVGTALSVVDLAPAAPPVVTVTVTPRPAVPRTLGELNRWMDQAVRAKGSVKISQAFVAADGFVSRREIGTAKWTGGKLSFDVVQSGEDLAQRYVVVPGTVHRLALEPVTGDWERAGEAEIAASERDYLTQLGRRMNPGQRYPGLPDLQVTRGRPRMVDGVRCWPYVVRMSLRQNLASMPEGVRWESDPQAAGTTVTTFFVDATGLPHKVVESSQVGRTRINEVTTFTTWGVKATITPPAG